MDDSNTMRTKFNLLHVDNKLNFSLYNTERLKNLFRKEIYDFLISRKDEDEYYDLDMFCSKFLNNNHSRLKIITQDIIQEIKNVLKWNVKLAFNDTAIFIYSSDEPPMMSMQF